MNYALCSSYLTDDDPVSSDKEKSSFQECSDLKLIKQKESMKLNKCTYNNWLHLILINQHRERNGDNQLGYIGIQIYLPNKHQAKKKLHWSILPLGNKKKNKNKNKNKNQTEPCFTGGQTCQVGSVSRAFFFFFFNIFFFF